MSVRASGLDVDKRSNMLHEPRRDCMVDRDAAVDPGFKAEAEGSEHASDKHDTHLDSSVGLGIVGWGRLGANLATGFDSHPNEFQDSRGKCLQGWPVVSF